MTRLSLAEGRFSTALEALRGSMPVGVEREEARWDALTLEVADAARVLATLNAALITELVAALRMADAWIDDGEYAAFAPASLVYDAGPTLRQVDRMRALRVAMRGALGKATDQARTVTP